VKLKKPLREGSHLIENQYSGEQDGNLELLKPVLLMSTGANCHFFVPVLMVLDGGFTRFLLHPLHNDITTWQFGDMRPVLNLDVMYTKVVATQPGVSLQMATDIIERVVYL
jgi:hypothetical protein